MGGSRLNNSDDDLNEDDGLRMNKDDSIVTSKAPKDVKMNMSVKREMNARLDEALSLSIDSAGLNKKSK
jgi:hypothetical protein